MSKNPELVVGPMDPDRVAALVGRTGVHHNARRLLQRSASIFTPELVASLSKPPDDIRTEALYAHADEVAKAAQKAGLKGKVVGASVRGGADVQDDDRVVVLTVEAESGRTFRAVLNYGKAKLDDAKQTATNIRRLRLGLDATSARLAMGNDAQADRPATGEEAEELRKYIAELEAEKAAREEGGEAEAEAAGPEEPIEGYDKLKVEDIEATIAAEEDPFERELLKRQVLAYEEHTLGDKARKGVKSATEPSQLVPAPSEDE